MSLRLRLLGLLTILALAWTTQARAAERPNILFIAVDDLRPAIGAYGDPIARTPNLDKLASQGVLFKRAYCQQAVCSPSRTSLLLGKRPDTTGVYDLKTHFRTTLPDVVTLPQYFKNSGYHTESMGKIYHTGLDDPPSWSVVPWSAAVPSMSDDAKAKFDAQRAAYVKEGKDPGKARGVPFENPDVPENQLPDGAMAEHAVELMRAYKAKPGQPFFLAVGLLRPHLPFISPKKYHDLYRREQFEVPSHREAPKDAPAYAGTEWGELRAYLTMPAKGPVTDDQAIDLIHAYYAAASYIDAGIGTMMRGLEETGLKENTIVIVWGDHGWSLGEHGFWCKHTNYEDATHAPLIIAGPGVKAAGAKTDALVEFVDVYPSLVELAGLKPVDGLEGTSFVPLLSDPARPWKKAAFSQYPRGKSPEGARMGYTLCTDRYRLVEWRFDGEPKEWELYDHQTDPKETVNLAGMSEHHAVLEQLKSLMKSGWQGAKP